MPEKKKLLLSSLFNCSLTFSYKFWNLQVGYWNLQVGHGVTRRSVVRHSCFSYIILFRQILVHEKV